MSAIDFSQRAELVEEMDRTDCDPAVLYATLRRFELTNLLITRYRTLLKRHVLSDMKRDPGRAYVFTDLGAGGCDITRWLVSVCRRQNLQIKVRAVEKDARIVRYARQANDGFPEIEVIESDACDPSCWGKPDYLFAQHLLHHLPDAACIQLLRALDQAESRRFIISDILRSRTAHTVFGVIARPMAAGTFILEDGLRSIRRGFTVEDINRMLGIAAMKHPALVRAVFPGRLVIAGGSAISGQ